MAQITVQVTAIGAPSPNRFKGTLINPAQVGKHCLIYLGGDQFFRIVNVKGWAAPIDSNWVILFDAEGYRYRVERLP